MEPAPDQLNNAFSLLAMLALIGLLLVGVAAMLFVLKRARDARRRHLDGTDLSQPGGWVEAGRRAEPIEPDPDLPSDDDL